MKRLSTLAPLVLVSLTACSEEPSAVQAAEPSVAAGTAPTAPDDEPWPVVEAWRAATLVPAASWDEIPGRTAGGDPPSWARAAVPVEVRLVEFEPLDLEGRAAEERVLSTLPASLVHEAERWCQDHVGGERGEWGEGVRDPHSLSAAVGARPGPRGTACALVTAHIPYSQRLLWAFGDGERWGRPVLSSIQQRGMFPDEELGLADLDGDGVDELATSFLSHNGTVQNRHERTWWELDEDLVPRPVLALTYEDELDFVGEDLGESDGWGSVLRTLLRAPQGDLAVRVEVDSTAWGHDRLTVGWLRLERDAGTGAWHTAEAWLSRVGDRWERRLELGALEE